MGLQSGKENWGAPSPGAAPGQKSHWGSLPSLGWKFRANSYQQGKEKFESQGDSDHFIDDLLVYPC